MRISTIDTNRRYEVTLQLFGEFTSPPDIFSDVEPNFPREWPMDDENNYIMCPQKAFDNMIKWWSDEVEDANDGFATEVLVPLTKKKIDEGFWYCLSVDEI